MDEVGLQLKDHQDNLDMNWILPNQTKIVQECKLGGSGELHYLDDIRVGG